VFEKNLRPTGGQQEKCLGSPWITDKMLATHMPNEIATTTLFLFHMAMLEALMSSYRCILEEKKDRTGHTREAQLTVKRR